MANYLPGLTQRTSVGGGAQQPTASVTPSSNAESTGLSNLGSAMGAAAGSMARDERQAALEIQKQKDEDAKVWAGSVVPDVTIKADQLLHDMGSQATANAPGFTKNYLAGLDTLRDETLALAPDETSKKYINQHFNSIRSSYGQKAVEFEASAVKSNRVNIYEKSGEDWANVVARDPSQTGVALTSLKDTLPDVGPGREVYLEKAKNSILKAAAGTSIERDPKTTFDNISTALNLPGAPKINVYKVANATEGMPTGALQLASAIMGQESNYGAVDTSQPNYGGARGPMQVTEPTFNGLKKKGLIPKDADWSNPTDSAAAGVALINDLWKKYDGDQRKVAAAYYAGEKAINADGTINDYKDLKNPKAPSTLQYAEQVMARFGKGQVEQPAAMVTAIDGEPTKTGIAWIDNMSPTDLLHYRNQAQTEMSRGTSVVKNGLQRREEDIQAMVTQGVVPRDLPSKDEYVTAFGPIEGPLRYREKIESSVALGKGISLLQAATPAERAGIIAAAGPTDQDGYAAQRNVQEGLIKANQIIEKQLKDDPASYVGKNSPRVKAAWENAQANKNDPLAMANFYNETLAEQKRLGVPDPKLLTNDQASRITSMFYDQKEGAKNAAELMEGLSIQYGGAWPTVYKQLAKDDKLPPAALVIPNMKDGASKERLARLSLVDEKLLRERLQPSDMKDIDNTLLNAMQPMWNTLSVQGGEKTYDTISSQAKKLAMSYVGQGKPIKDAVNQAVDEVAGHKYQFETTYRIPKVEIPEQVVGGIGLVKRALKSNEMVLIPPPAMPGMKAEDNQKQWNDAVATKPVFVTNPDESGVLLYVEGKNGLAKVNGPDGQYAFTWADLRKQSVATQTEEQSQANAARNAIFQQQRKQLGGK